MVFGFAITRDRLAACRILAKVKTHCLRWLVSVLISITRVDNRSKQNMNLHIFNTNVNAVIYMQLYIQVLE